MAGDDEIVMNITSDVGVAASTSCLIGFSSSSSTTWCLIGLNFFSGQTSSSPFNRCVCGTLCAESDKISAIPSLDQLYLKARALFDNPAEGHAHHQYKYNSYTNGNTNTNKIPPTFCPPKAHLYLTPTEGDAHPTLQGGTCFHNEDSIQLKHILFSSFVSLSVNQFVGFFCVSCHFALLH